MEESNDVGKTSRSETVNEWCQEMTPWHAVCRSCLSKAENKRTVQKGVLEKPVSFLEEYICDWNIWSVGGISKRSAGAFVKSIYWYSQGWGATRSRWYNTTTWSESSICNLRDHNEGGSGIYKEGECWKRTGQSGLSYKLFKCSPKILQGLWKVLQVLWRNGIIPQNGISQKAFLSTRRRIPWR